MVIWFMMKPIMHLCIKICNPLKLIFSEPNITLLNLMSHFKNYILAIGKSSHHSFNMPMLIISYYEPYSSLSFWLFEKSHFSKLANNPPGIKTSWRRRSDVSLYVPVTSQVRLKWNTQRRLDGTSPRRLSGASLRKHHQSVNWEILKFVIF